MSHALTIRAAAHFSKRRLHLAENSLDLPYFEDMRYRVRQGVPIPATLDYQLDYFTIKYMLKRMSFATKRLTHIIYNNKQDPSIWYEVYLACLVLLCSLESVHQGQIQMMQRWGESVSLPKPLADCDRLMTVLPQASAITAGIEHTSLMMIHEWRHAAKVLLYHYRMILKAMIPFQTPWEQWRIDEMTGSADFDQDSANYVKSVIEIKLRRGNAVQIKKAMCFSADFD